MASGILTLDRGLLPRGLRRVSFPRFILWMLPWVALGVFGFRATWLCLASGLNQTNMDNRFAFGLWIFLDLTIIAWGAGAFFTGFLLYILRKKELKAVINSAVVVGFICYSGAIAALVVDVGQPLRAWFTFWHPNVHSMLTEVTFCISCYLCVLAVEYLPILLRNRGMKKNLSVFAFEFELHKVMVVFAAVGTFLSFFHQGSLGGLYGVMRGRPFAFREGLAIWPSTFFLFILSAIAVGPSFLALITWAVGKITRKPLVKPEVLDLLARISGRLLLVYVLAKTIDTLVWLNHTSEASGFHPYGFYSDSTFGSWLLGVEIVLLGLVPAVILSRKALRSRTGWLVAGATLACLGVALNRFVQTIQTQALPTLPTDRLLVYWPSWQEIGVGAGVIAYGVILYSLSYRYLPLFPQERELQGS